jgi:hypothetical protein
VSDICTKEQPPVYPAYRFKFIEMRTPTTIIIIIIIITVVCRRYTANFRTDPIDAVDWNSAD